ncbi:unnamed protein product [Paramecium sonneborni]|uniref:Uncharacterized protein n=1 Tax=Paramecium sonneborni TaxID=65129 RepID=A0A8S1RPQ8_9CILI|nr:unnamed protein product [Paramecium sonneborni]
MNYILDILNQKNFKRNQQSYHYKFQKNIIILFWILKMVEYTQQFFIINKNNQQLMFILVIKQENISKLFQQIICNGKRF